MANPPGLGGYQPPTYSNSSRRADFDLRRILTELDARVTLLEAGGGGGGDGANEVWIGTSDPIAANPTIELWYDSDAIAGPTGPIAYVHNQGAAASTWVIVHNLGWNPNVLIEDSGGTTVEGEIVHNSTNQLTLTFSAAFAGVAYLS